MEKRHQVTNLEKYEELHKEGKIESVIGSLISIIGLTCLGTILTKSARIEDCLKIFAASTGITAGLVNVVSGLVRTITAQQKIDELKDQEENQSRSR